MTENKLFGNSEQLEEKDHVADPGKMVGDLISRQAAIDAICEDGTQLERQGQYSMTMAERKQRDVDILEALPSAQPIAKDIYVPVKDCISRQAALDALGERPIVWTDNDYVLGERNQYDMDRLAIETVPSAQPEPIRLRLDHELSKEEYERLKKDCAEQPIILLPKESAQPGEDIRAMCGECDAWNQYKNHPQPGWIPWDSGKFPEESGCYIVTAYDGSGSRVTFAKYQKRLKRWELTGARAYWRVLAWMPLPEPWKGEPND